MNQLVLFDADADVRDPNLVALANDYPSHPRSNTPSEMITRTGITAVAIQARPIDAPPISEESLVFWALHAITPEEFRSRMEPLLSDAEREAISVADPLPHQLARVFDQVVERLTTRWADLADWPPFGWIVEPRQELKPDLEALTLELFRPSRGLSGRVAFRVGRDLRQVTDPIPLPVLEVTREYRDVFRAWTYLEPIYAVNRWNDERKLLRSLAAVRREHSRPIDPIVIGWLGARPRDYRLKRPRPRSRVASNEAKATPQQPGRTCVPDWALGLAPRR